MKKQKQLVGFGMVFAGLVFFFNPNIQLFDLLPDGIGALLIYFGLKHAAEAGAYFDDARKISFSLIWLYVIKTALAVSLLRYPANALPYTFLSGVAETVFLIPFFTKLYDGFEYASMRSADGSTAAYVKDVRVLSVLFVVCRSLFAFLPEILELLQQNDELDLSANASYRMPIIRLKPYVELFCVTIVFILGIWYLLRMRSFFARVKKDAILAGYLNDLYQKAHENDRALYASRTFGASLVLLAASAVFVVDFTLDGYDFLPDLLGVLCVLAAFGTLSHFDKRKPPALPLVLYAAAGAVSTAAAYCFRPTAFLLLTASGFEKNQGESFAVRFFESVSAPWMALLAGILYVAGTVFLLVSWIKRAKNYCQAETIGSYDAKLLSCSVLYGLTALFKAVLWGVEALQAHLACEAAVAKHLAARSHMSVARFAESVAQSPSVALFERLDSMVPLVTLVTYALALFTVLSLLSFKAASARAFDPNAEA